MQLFKEKYFQYYKGKITHNKILKRIRAANKKIDAPQAAESKLRSAGLEYTKGLIESGGWEVTAAGLRKIPK